MSKITKSQIINFSAKMDNRANSEVLNVNPNENGIVFDYLENADLYNTKALKNRKGVVDFCGGVVNADVVVSEFINTVSGVSISGSTTNWLGLSTLDPTGALLDYPVTVFVPSGDTILTDYTVNIREQNNNTQQGINIGLGYIPSPLEIRGYLFKLDQTPVPASGAGYMSGTSTSVVYDIALGGTFDTVVPPFPEYQSQEVPVAYSAVPVAVCSALINFDTTDYVSDGSLWTAYASGTTLKFDAPVAIDGDVAYGIRWVKHFPDFGTTNLSRGISIETIQNNATDIDVKSRLMQEFFYIGAPANQIYAIRNNYSTIGAEKTWVLGTCNQYTSNPILDIDYTTADTDMLCPMQSGSNYASATIYPTEYRQFVGNRTDGYYQPAEFGQVFILPSGVDTYYGTFFHAALANSVNSIISPYSADTNIGVRTSIYKVDNFTGTLAGGDYQTTATTLLATASGNFVLPVEDKNTLLQGDFVNKPDYRLSKIYTMFDNPIELSGDGIGTDHLVTFGFYDYTTGGPITDSMHITVTATGPTSAYAPFRVGIETQTKPAYSGNYVMDYSGNGTFAHPSGVYTNPAAYPFDEIHFDLTCGLVNIATGNAIQGIYDYRIGADRNSQIVYGQAGDIRYFDLDFPNKLNHQTIFSSGSTLDDSLYTFETYDDLLFAHQYSQISGQTWNQIYPSTMDHGQRPIADVSMVSGTGTGGQFVSGTTYNVLVSNEYSSGGQRSSVAYPIASGLAVTSGSNFIQVSGLANQFKFDVPDAHMYVWVSPSGGIASGVSYYLANVYDQPDTTAGTLLNYPLLSGTNVVYIERPANPDADQSTAAITTYPNSYFISQVDTPKAKKIKVFYDYLIMIGDPDFSSRMWYSEQYAPEIWGESFDFHGFVDVDKDNGSPLVSMEKLREYLILFKKNATYRVEFLGDNAQPFSINQISNTIGSLGAFGTVQADDVVYGLCQYGVFMCNGAGIEIISDSINPYYQGIDHNDLTFAVAIHDKNEDKIIWSISNNNGSPSKNYGIMLNYKEKSFSVRRGSMWNAGGVVGDDDAFDVLLGGTVNGQIQQIEKLNVDVETIFNDGNDVDATTAIQLIGTTPWMSIGDSQISKQLRNLDFNIDGASTSQIAIDVFTDQNETKRYTRYVSLAGNDPDKRTHLGGQAKTVKFRIYNIGLPDIIKIKSMAIYFNPLGYDDNY